MRPQKSTLPQRVSIENVSYLHLSPDLREDIPTEGLVLGLVLEAQLIARDHLWVKHTLKSSSRTLCELLTVEQLR